MHLSWTLILLSVLISAIAVHNWANAQRPIAMRATVRVGSLRWWFPWPRRAEFPDDRTWRLARAAQVAINIWCVATLVTALVDVVALTTHH